jgi:hypothetical protein
VTGSPTANAHIRLAFTQPPAALRKAAVALAQVQVS